MSFSNPLYDRIQQLIGVQHYFEDDFSFLQPSGNDHSAQFCFRTIPTEYSDLGHYDQQHFFLLDLLEETGIEYLLDDDGKFAVFIEKNKKGVKVVQSILDLRNETIAVFYYFGIAKQCFQFNARLMMSSKLTPCYLNPTALMTVSKSLSAIGSLQYHFEQTNQVFQNAVVMKGAFKGSIVHDAYDNYCDQFNDWFNVVQLSGHTTDGSQGIMTIDANGKLQIDICRLSSFLKIVDNLYKMLSEKYQFILEKHIIGWNGNQNSNSVSLCSSPVQVDLPFPIEFIENLAKMLTNGRKPLNLIGLYERVSPKLWKVFITDLNTSNQINLNISNHQVLIFMHNKCSLPLLDKIEFFIRNYVAANFESLALN